MAISTSSGRLARPVVLLIAIAFVGSALLLAGPPARAAFQNLDVQPGRYTGTNLYVPGETMAITLTAGSGDVFDIEVLHWIPPSGTRTTQATFDNETVPASGMRTVTWLIPNTAADSPWYWVVVYGPNWFESSGSNPAPCGAFGCDAYLFEIRGYNFNAWLDRTRYIPGDTVTVGWSATLVRDGSPAPDGDGEIQAYNGATSLLPSPHLFTASQGTFSFRLSTSADPNRDPFVRIWFNDTSGSRHHVRDLFFDIGFLDAILSVGATYPPGAIVTIDVWAKAAASAGMAGLGSPGVSGAVVNITISDVATGATTPYGATDLSSAADGRVTHVFQLAPTPTSAVYDVQIRVTAHGSLTTTESDTFEVRATPLFSVQLSLDRSAYVSGETASAEARVDPGGTNVTYQWRIYNVASGAALFQRSTGSPKLAYPIPANFTGNLGFIVTANDGQGNDDTATQTVGVASGYLGVTLDRTLFDAGDTITATYTLRSVVMTAPTYFYEVRNVNGDLVRSGNLSTSSFAFPTPAAASAEYTFTVTASDAGRVVQGSATAFQAALFVLGLSLDRPSYLPGETMRVGYTIAGRGPVSWPSVFQFSVNLVGSTATIVTTTTRSGEFALRIPEGTNEGDLVLIVFEANTAAQAIETVHIGSTNPLWTTEVAGIPTFAVLLALLVALLIVGFLFLWRRTAGGMGPRPTVEKPAPPPPPAGPERRPPTSPMSVACKNCAKTIDLTTSKRPIEVMCPSCGETQLVT